MDVALPGLAAGLEHRGAGETDTVFVFHKARKNEARALSFHFVLPAKGGGDTEMELRAPPEEFHIVLAMMSAADRQVALKAMANELQHQISNM